MMPNALLERGTRGDPATTRRQRHENAGKQDVMHFRFNV
jgi:hypothetical protein